MKKLVHFLVFPRRGDSIEHIQDWDYEHCDMDFVDISSTEIRNGENNAIIDVEGYIKQYDLY